MTSRHALPGVHHHVPTAVGPLRVDGHYRALTAEALGHVADQGRCFDRSSVDGHLVRSRFEKTARIAGGAHASTDRQRNPQLPSNLPHHLVLVAAALGRGGDVQDDDLVRALTLVLEGALGRIAGVAQLLELDSLDHAAVVHIQTGKNAPGNHAAPPSIHQLNRECPHSPDSSG